MKTWVALGALMLATGCASDWRTREPVTPISYAAEVARAPHSVGRLARLAVLPVTLHIEVDESTRSQPDWPARREDIARALQGDIARYLSEHKGYEVVIVDQAVAVADAAGVRAAGRRLGVDGLVATERWITRPWSTAKAVANIFLLDIPLFMALAADNLRIDIHETASGRLVWRRTLGGEDSDTAADLDAALGDLDNAVPAALRR